MKSPLALSRRLRHRSRIGKCFTNWFVIFVILSTVCTYSIASCTFISHLNRWKSKKCQFFANAEETIFAWSETFQNGSTSGSVPWPTWVANHLRCKRYVERRKLFELSFLGNPNKLPFCYEENEPARSTKLVVVSKPQYRSVRTMSRRRLMLILIIIMVTSLTMND